MNANLSRTLLLTALIALAGLPAFAAGGAIYTLTNSSSGNAVLVYSRTADGQISPAGSFSTGGTGTGKGLGNQGALATDSDRRLLFAVNAGSNSISTFAIRGASLRLIDTVPSGGLQPISLTVRRHIVYVLNNGGAVGDKDTIAGFSVNEHGRLEPIVSGLPLSAASVGPAEISFNSEGDFLLVTEKMTNNIDVFSVEDGVAFGPTVVPSVGQTPFGFAFNRHNQVFVSDAFGGAAGAGAVSSYSLSDDGTLQTLSSMVPDNQSAPCWVVLTRDGDFLYTTNTASGTVSGYSVGSDGTVTLLNVDGVTANTGTGSIPLDAAISKGSRFLYVLTPGSSNIQGFAIGENGSLTPLTQATGVPTSSSGLVAR